jgi:hypothetical protein
MLESAIFYPIAMFLGFLGSCANAPATKKHFANKLVIIFAPICWAVACYVYIPDFMLNKSITNILNSLFNAKYAFESLIIIPNRVGAIFPVGAIFWFAAVFNILNIYPRNEKSGNGF